MKINKKYVTITFICVMMSIIFGFITNDLLIGGTIVATGLLCAYFASEGKRINYIMGLINYVLMGYVALKNNLFGIFFFYIFVFSPLQIHGFISWKNNLDDNASVNVREFNLRNSIIITISCTVGSFLLGYLLSLIPSQRLAFMDATSNCINLCGVILMVLRFKESWWLWLINNIIDLSIWIITFINKGSGSEMMLLVSIGYLLINIYGVIKWHIEATKNMKKEKINI